MGEFEIKIESDSIFTIEAAYGPKGDKGDTGFPGDNPNVFDYTLRLTEPIHSQFKFYYNGNWFNRWTNLLYDD